MGLTPDQIAAIYKKKEEKAAAPKRTGGGGRKKKPADFNDRSYQAWFALEHTDPGEAFCDNAECQDPHSKVRVVEGQKAEQVVADVAIEGDDGESAGTVKMCRYCFTFRWMIKRSDTDQTQLAV